MFLLIRVAESMARAFEDTLHSTMFLLILYPCLDEVLLFLTLHSTMFLLIHEENLKRLEEFHPLHSTMFLLILARYFPYDEVFPLYIPLCFY